MYRVENENAFKFLIGKELEFLIYGPYTVTLQFQEGHKIAAERKLHLIELDGSSVVMTCHQIASCGRLLQLIGTIITNITIEDTDKLYLHFSNGQKLLLIDDSDRYESFNISDPDIGIIVV